MTKTALLIAFLFGCSSSTDDTGDWSAPTEMLTDGERWWVSWTSSPQPPPFNEVFSLTVEATDPDTGSPAEGTSFALEILMPDHGHGMQVSPVISEVDAGKWLAEGAVLHMEGLWEIRVGLTDETGQEAAIFDLMCCD